jgi:hypothetical protein
VYDLPLPPLLLLLLLVLESEVLAIPLERCAARPRRATCAADQQQQCDSCLLAMAWPRPLPHADGSMCVVTPAARAFNFTNNYDFLVILKTGCAVWQQQQQQQQLLQPCASERASREVCV